MARRLGEEITRRSRGDHEEITGRSRGDHEEITGRSRGDHEEITGRSRGDHELAIASPPLMRSAIAGCGVYVQPYGSTISRRTVSAGAVHLCGAGSPFRCARGVRRGQDECRDTESALRSPYSADSNMFSQRMALDLIGDGSAVLNSTRHGRHRELSHWIRWQERTDPASPVCLCGMLLLDR